MVLQITMLSRIEHSSTTLPAVVNLEITRGISFLLFQVSALNHYTNLCLRVDIYMRGIDDVLKKLNTYNSTSYAVNCDLSQKNYSNQGKSYLFNHTNTIYCRHNAFNTYIILL